MPLKNSSPLQWSLLAHLRTHWCIEPDSPQHPCWKKWELLLDEEVLGFHGPSQVLRERCQTLGADDTPLALAIYQWANRNSANRTMFLHNSPLGGEVNSDPRVRAALCDVAVAHLSSKGHFFYLHDVVAILVQWSPLPERLVQCFRHAFGTSETYKHMRAWSVPFTGMLPTNISWQELKNGLDDTYPLRDVDLGASNIVHPRSEYHHHRMDLVLASWMSNAGSSKNLSTPLAKYLPKIAMEHPDDCTAVLWWAILQLIETKPHGREIPLLTQWMAEHAEYSAFVQTHRHVIESLFGSDPLECGKEINRLWQQRHEVVLDDVCLQSMLEP